MSNPPVSAPPACACVSLDEAERLISLSYSGYRESQSITGDIFAHIRALEAPWTYDILIDFSDYKGVVLTSDMETLAARWNAIAQGRDRGRLGALISTDSLFRARMPLRVAAFPLRTIRLFCTPEDARDWIRTERDASSHSLAS